MIYWRAGPIKFIFISRNVPFLLVFKMEALYGIPFHVLEVPNLKLKKPGWVKPPSAMVVFAFVLLSYFLVTGGKLWYSISRQCFVKRRNGLQKKNSIQRSKFSLLTSHSTIRLFFSYTARLKIAVVFFAGLLNLKSTTMWVIFIY